MKGHSKAACTAPSERTPEVDAELGSSFSKLRVGESPVHVLPRPLTPSSVPASHAAQIPDDDAGSALESFVRVQRSPRVYLFRVLREEVAEVQKDAERAGFSSEVADAPPDADGRTTTKLVLVGRDRDGVGSLLGRLGKSRGEGYALSHVGAAMVVAIITTFALLSS
jgi:hypothetical protein